MKAYARNKTLLALIIIGGASVFLWNCWSPRPQLRPGPAGHSSAEARLQQAVPLGGEVSGTEIPATAPGEILIGHRGYALVFDTSYKHARWVAYSLSAAQAAGGIERSDNFRADPFLGAVQGADKDYRGSGYDRGHLAPAADMAWSEEAMDASFYFSNISPQQPGFNRGIWKKLESKVRAWAVKYDSICVVTGPLLDQFIDTIGPGKLPVPARFYKAVLDCSPPGWKAIAFLLPNRPSREGLQAFSLSIDSLETLSGLDLFPALTDTLEERLEASTDLSLWDWE